MLTWHPAGDVPVTCLRGRFSPSQGDGQIYPGRWDFLGLKGRHVFGNTVRHKYIHTYMYVHTYIMRVVLTNKKLGNILNE